MKKIYKPRPLLLVLPLLFCSQNVKAGPLAGRHINEITITKHPGNYTSFKIETPREKTIVTDPFRVNESISPHIVTESHNHSDHTDVSRLQGTYRLLRSEGEHLIDGVRVIGIKGHHNQKGIEPDVQNTIFIFEIDGVHIAQFGSQGRLLDDQAYRKAGKVDVVILQVYESKDKLTIQECVQVIRRLGAKIIIPAHGDQKLAPELAIAIEGTFETISTGVLTLDKKILEKSAHKPMVIVLDVKDANPFY